MTLDDQTFQKRATAYKVRIADIINGEYVSDDFGSYLKNLNLKITRVRLMGTIIDKRLYEGGENPDFTEGPGERSNHAFIVLDDGSGIIRLKTWKKDIEKLSRVEVGDIVDAVARVREYQDEIYAVPEFVNKIENPNWELLREIDIIKLKKIYLNRPQKSKQISPTPSTETKVKEKRPIEEPVEESVEKTVEDAVAEKKIDQFDQIKEKILDQISSYNSGLSRDELYDLINVNKLDIDESINELMTDGKIYENPDGKIQMV
jgi:RPA family protein